MKLSVVTAADAETLAGVHALAFPEPWSAPAIAKLFEGPGVYGFLVSQDEPLGMIVCRAAVDDAEVLTIAVTPGAQRRGIGRALIEAAARAGCAAGATAMFLEVAVDNVSALALYERAGFRRIALRAGYYDRGAEGLFDAVVMRLDLPEEVS
jgi:ribosomal-protein-alanine N-acetyltransferase